MMPARLKRILVCSWRHRWKALGVNDYLRTYCHACASWPAPNEPGKREPCLACGHQWHGGGCGHIDSLGDCFCSGTAAPVFP